MALASAITVDGVGAEWALADALNIGTGQLTVSNGAFDTDTYNLTCGTVSSTSTNGRTIDFGSSTITLSTAPSLGTTETARAALTFTSGTSQINLSFATGTFNGNNQTFYNVSFTSVSISSILISGANTFNNLTVAGRTSAGISALSLAANQTINGTLTLSAGTNATMRTFVRSDTIGTTRTLTCAAVASLTDIDFRDITIAGAAAPVSGTRLGDGKGNTGITFGAGKTVYWAVAIGDVIGSGNARFSLTNGGSASIDNFPLAQDTMVFPSSPTAYPSSGNQITINADYNIGTIDMSARTTDTMTLTCSQSPLIYGNWINGTGVTLSGAGTLTFAGRGSQTLTSAGRTFTQGFRFDTPNGSVTLQDAFLSSANSTSALTLAHGTFDANSYNVTFIGTTTQLNYASTSNVRTLAVGSGTWTIPGANAGAWNAGAAPINLTITGTGTITLTGGTAKTFIGGGIDYSGITLNQGGAGALTFSGNNTFANISSTATGATTISFGTTTQRVADFTATGTAGNVLTIQGTSATSPCTLIHTGAGDIDIDYVTITGVRAYQT